MPSRQEIYDTVKKHLLSQGAKSIDSNGIASLRGNDGRKCAVGCLIPDDKYTENMEGDIYGSLKEVTGFNDELFIAKLVVVHDYKPISTWGDELMRVAKEHGLTP